MLLSIKHLELIEESDLVSRILTVDGPSIITAMIIIPISKINNKDLSFLLQNKANTFLTN